MVYNSSKSANEWQNLDKHVTVVEMVLYCHDVVVSNLCPRMQ